LHTSLVAICGESDVAIPGHASYGEWARPYNRDESVAVTPAAITRPANALEVAEIVRYARENNYKIQAKSGGHSYANFGLGGPGARNVIVVDLSLLRSVHVDKTTWNARLGSGCLLGDVTTQLHELGGRAFAHGVCPGVGIGGHATIGGLGPMSRMWGSCLDHIVEVEAVTADGTICRANEKQNADLFWGIRGAGASLAIVTEFVVLTHPEPATIVQYSYTFAFGEHDIAHVFKAWLDLAYDPELDRRLGTLFIITGLGVVIEAIYYGTSGEYEESGISKRLPHPSATTIVLEGWLGHLVQAAAIEGLKASNLSIPFYGKSLGFRQQDRITDEAVDKMFQFISDAPKGHPEAYFIIFSAQGGATNDVPSDATAYAHRDKIMFYESYAINIPSINADNRAFISGFHSLMMESLTTPTLVSTTYPGYVDLDLGTGVVSGPAYWGDNYPALRLTKSKWDPSELFYNSQSVRPVDPYV